MTIGNRKISLAGVESRETKQVLGEAPVFGIELAIWQALAVQSERMDAELFKTRDELFPLKDPKQKRPALGLEAQAVSQMQEGIVRVSVDRLRKFIEEFRMLGMPGFHGAGHHSGSRGKWPERLSRFFMVPQGLNFGP